MRKRLKRETSICSCKSPRLQNQISPRSFNWYEADLWTVMMGSLWRRLRQLADGFTPSSCMTLHENLFASVIFKSQPHVKWHSSRSSSMVRYPLIVFAYGSYPYNFRDNEKHIGKLIFWMRIGAFFFDSKVAHLSERLSLPLKIINKDEVEKAVESCGACVPSNIREGIWIAGNSNLIFFTLEMLVLNSYLSANLINSGSQAI
ncbi:hypothetical protein DKX38_003126 [Salix brachista]|uniref:Uncharacterized protein n=1 Tax=Salix brachista TaxID=2182728 RepID=A0A5N5NRF2_9ROSI|nr:hypothetical protein DKX38_003126 [Salix brachista]